MSYTAIENTPIQVNLLTASNYTGWTVDGAVANHSSCQNGYIKLITYPLIVGNTYEVSYSVLSIASNYVQLFAGTTGGVQRTTAGNYVETITANGTQLSFFSNGTCSIKAFNIRNTADDTSNYQQHTIVYSSVNRKWNEFRTIAPDYGFSLYIDMLTVYQGALYLHQNDSDSRNNFYGTQYDSIFQFVENKNPEQLKSYNSIALQSNELLITSTDGIVTSLGQVSELSEYDFIKSTLQDAISVTTIQAQEGIFSASFLRDKRFDLINGDKLKGNYITIELVTNSGNAILQLFSVAVNASQSHIGTR